MLIEMHIYEWVVKNNDDFHYDGGYEGVVPRLAYHRYWHHHRSHRGTFRNAYFQV